MALAQSRVAISSNPPLVTEAAKSVELIGTLVRDSGGFALRSEGATPVRLVIHRVPVDHVEKRVRIMGVWIDEQTVEADGIAPI